jgi:hypothetical protein
MEEFIAQISSGVALMSQLVNNGEYDLMKDDLVVPRHLWASMVFPGSSISMRARKLASSPMANRKVSWLRKSMGKGGGE